MARILMVDGDMDVCEACAGLLKFQGYDVTTVRSAEAALDLLQSARFDLLVVDLLLPGIDGAELARILRNDRQNGRVPIVMFSSAASRMGITISEADARWAPINRFLEKDGDLSKLIRTIAELLQRDSR